MSKELTEVNEEDGFFSTSENAITSTKEMAASMGAALEAAGESVPAMISFAKMLKNNGVWVEGEGQGVIAIDKEYIVNIMSIKMGFIGWLSSEPVEFEGIERGEVMRPINAPNPVTLAELPVIKVKTDQDGWRQQIGFEFRPVGGNTRMIYKSSANGAFQAVAGLAKEISAKLNSGAADAIPVLTLASESYKNKKYGGITFKPIFNIARWITLDEAKNGGVKAAVSEAAADDMV